MMEMKRLKPTSYDVYPVFTCPTCSAEWQQTIEETEFPAGVLCFCGERLSFETIMSVDVVPSFNRSPVKSKKRTVSKASDRNVNHSEVSSALVKLGFSKSEANKAIQECASESVSSPEELLELILSLA